MQITIERELNEEIGEQELTVEVDGWKFSRERQTWDSPGGVWVEDIEYSVYDENGTEIKGIKLTDREYSKIEDMICEHEEEDHDPRAEPEYWD